VESLESRVVLYSATGNAWPHPQLVTISFMPDGTDLGGVPSNLQSSFNSKPSLNGRWQGAILKAAQAWAQVTNLNFAVVPDNGASFGAGNYQQGDPGFGDIRIGGYNFGNSTLAWAYQPPPVNNFSPAGDIEFNTGQCFNIGSTYDLFTVATHEIGHALGLDHSSTAMAMMFGNYNGAKAGLNGDDVQGIQSIYGVRKQDVYDSVAPNGTFGTATNLNSLINTQNLTALATGIDITTTSDLDYYKVNVPAGTNGTMQLTVQSSGLSQLSPNVTVYASDQATVLGSASGLNQDGTTLTVTVKGVTANQLLYVKVSGADTTAFSTGAYALTLNFGNNPSPTVPLPNTQTLNGNPLSMGGGEADSAGDGFEHQHGFPNGPLGTRGKHHHGHNKGGHSSP
jgi:hypothetical protein